MILLVIIPYFIGRIINYKYDNQYYRREYLQSIDFKFLKWVYGMIIIIVLLIIYLLGKAIGNDIF